MMRSGMPCPPQYGGASISNIRNTGARIGDARAPVLLTNEEERDDWLRAPRKEASALQRPFAGRAVAGRGEGVFDDLDSGN
jgi:hypothetical protein